jgi:hypothetical protein
VSLENEKTLQGAALIQLSEAGLTGLKDFQFDIPPCLVESLVKIKKLDDPVSDIDRLSGLIKLT